MVVMQIERKGTTTGKKNIVLIEKVHRAFYKRDIMRICLATKLHKLFIKLDHNEVSLLE